MSSPSVAGKAGVSPRTAPRVAVLDAPGAVYVENAEVERKVLSPRAEARPVLVPESRRAELPDVEADYVILWHRVSLDAEFFARNRTCRAVVCASVGHEHVDTDAARAHGIPVYHVPHYGTEEVADHTLALFLALARRLTALHGHARDGGWDWRAVREAGEPHRLRGGTWGIVGLGRIGLAVAGRARAFGMRVLFHDPYAHPGIEKSLGVERCPDLETLLERSDTVSLHVPLDAGTRHLLDGARLARMKRGAVLVNTARGGLIDLAALKGALAGERPAHAALDVVEGEPAIPGWVRDHPRILLSPHTAFYSAESLTELRTRAAEAVLQMIEGTPVTSAFRVL